MAFFDYTLFNMGANALKGDPIQPRADIPYESAEKLKKFADDYSQKYPYDPAKPYSGQLTAPRTSTQDTGQNLLSQYITSPVNKYFTTAGDEISKTVTGGYDPRQSPYYKAAREEILRNADTSRDAILRKSATSGMLHSDPRRIQERMLAEETSGQLANLVGQIYENERNRQVNTLPAALELGRITENIPLTRIGAAETYGAAPQQFEQQSLDRLYNEYIRQLSGAREPLNIYEGLSSRTYAPYPAQAIPSTSNAEALGQLAQMAMQVLPYLL